MKRSAFIKALKDNRHKTDIIRREFNLYTGFELMSNLNVILKSPVDIGNGKIQTEVWVNRACIIDNTFHFTSNILLNKKVFSIDFDGIFGIATRKPTP